MPQIMENVRETADRVDQAMAGMPVVAILRGVKPDEILDIADVLVGAGIRIIEVPLNSPDPFASIEKLAAHVAPGIVVGAGTVLRPDDIEKLARAGGQIAVTPNTDPEVIAAALSAGILPMPGFQTPTEALAAYKAGARYLKMFPSGSLGLDHWNALKAVLPADVKVLAVGGVGAGNAGEWLAAGIAGLGIGSELYRAGDMAQIVSAKAAELTGKLSATA